MLDCGYIVERNGLSVHYFVSNIYSLKVITNFIYKLITRLSLSTNEFTRLIEFRA